MMWSRFGAAPGNDRTRPRILRCGLPWKSSSIRSHEGIRSRRYAGLARVRTCWPRSCSRNRRFGSSQVSHRQEGLPEGASRAQNRARRLPRRLELRGQAAQGPPVIRRLSDSRALSAHAHNRVRPSAGRGANYGKVDGFSGLAGARPGLSSTLMSPERRHPVAPSHVFGSKTNTCASNAR